MRGVRHSRIGLLLLVTACPVESIDHAVTGGRDTDSCGGTGGLCNIDCSSDDDCATFSEFAVCNDAGFCESTTSCLSAEACGPGARCSDFGECAPLGTAELGESCLHPAQCASGVCADVCVARCVANQDCMATERCTTVNEFAPFGGCTVSPACERCTEPNALCTPATNRCATSCRQGSDCDEGDCIAADAGPWMCSTEPPQCPPSAFRLAGICFEHQACRNDDDCPPQHTCRAPKEGFDGGYCSPEGSE